MTSEASTLPGRRAAGRCRGPGAASRSASPPGSSSGLRPARKIWRPTPGSSITTAASASSCSRHQRVEGAVDDREPGLSVARSATSSVDHGRHRGCSRSRSGSSRLRARARSARTRRCAVLGVTGQQRKRVLAPECGLDRAIGDHTPNRRRDRPVASRPSSLRPSLRNHVRDCPMCPGPGNRSDLQISGHGACSRRTAMNEPTDSESLCDADRRCAPDDHAP